MQDLDPRLARLLEEGCSQVKRGETDEALASMREALSLPGFREAAGTEANCLVAEVLKEYGQQLAKNEKVAEAVAAFEKAQDLDPDLRLATKTEASRIAADSLIEKGRVRAVQAVEPDRVVVKRETLDQAISLFQKALQLDPNRRLQPEVEANRLVSQSLIANGMRLAQQNKVDEGLKAFELAKQCDPDLRVNASDWNELCWWGSLWGRAKDVLFAGDRAVELEPANGIYHDTRGLARSLTGDLIGAIEDFQAYVAWAEKQREPGYQIAKRRSWIDSLRAKKNPFTSELRAQLRTDPEAP